MRLYGGIDLHSTNSYVAVLDDDDQLVYGKRLVNWLEVILRELKPYREELSGVAVESTFTHRVSGCGLPRDEPWYEAEPDIFKKEGL